MNKKSKAKSSFDDFAQEYDKSMGDTGDYTHQKTIDPALFEAIGKYKNKTIYDVACGNGYVSRKLANGGAKEVWASDISENLIKIAQTKYENPQNKIKYFVSDSSDFNELPENRFDLVVMNMALHYVPDFEKFTNGLKKVLKKNGRFVFSHPHPLSKLAVKHARNIFAQKDIDNLVEDASNYLSVKSRVDYNLWTGEENILYHHAPINHYINILSKHGLYTDKFIEKETHLNINFGENQGLKHSSIPFTYALSAIKI